MPSFYNSKASGHSDKNVSGSGDDMDFVLPEEPLVLQNRYVIIKPLGQGGMGAVFLAQDKRLSNRFCVVKKLRLEGFNNDDRQKAMAFFEREAMILSSLKHPNIVSIQDYFQEHGNYFLVMEYVKGDNLQRLLRKRGEPFNEKQVIEWTNTILDVLHYLHSHKPPVIYRDIKPSNIMLSTADGIKLVDFGIARPYAEQENTRIVSGGYSPPEQYWGGADLRSDIYALGATMYYLLTGKEPLALQRCSTKFPKSTVCEDLDKVIQRATTQDVWLRYQTAKEMQEALVLSKTNKVLVPNYVLIAGIIGFITIACIAFIFIGQNEHWQERTRNIFSASGDAKNNTEKRTSVWQIPFEIATLASGEEIITDPDGLKDLSIKHSPNKKKR